MSLHQEARLAERIERHRLFFAFFVFLFGLSQALVAMEFHYPRQVYPVVNFTHDALLLSQMVALAFLVFGAVRIFRTSCATSAAARRRLMIESFVERSNLTALALSWVITFAASMLLAEWAGPHVLFFGSHDPGSLAPTTFYFALLKACMALSYSLTFLVMIRRGGDEPAEVTA